MSNHSKEVVIGTIVTGAFGNIGAHTVEALLALGHKVRCFDVPTPANKSVARQFEGRVEVVWGDLRNPEDVAKAVAGRQTVVHLASIIPPLSERQPELATAVNIEGTRNLIEAAVAQDTPPKLVFASSVSVHGRGKRSQLLSTDDPLSPSDHYSHTKVEGEKLVKASTLESVILRINAAIPVSIENMDPIMFEMGLEQNVEFIHPRDAGRAFANAATTDGLGGKVFFVGGGEKCQLTYREFYARLLDAVGIGELPPEAYSKNEYYTNWMNTEKSQAVLDYQRSGFDDFCGELARMMGWRKPFVLAFRPIIRAWVLSMSPYYAGHRVQIAHPVWWALILFGMSLTGVLAFHDAAFGWWSQNVTSVLPQGLIQGIFVVAVAIHFSEAAYAYRLARKIGHNEAALGWFWQTVMLGYASLGLLVKRAKGVQEKDVAPPMAPV